MFGLCTPLAYRRLHGDGPRLRANNAHITSARALHPGDRERGVVSLSLYAYARGNRSSREIERACREDVVYALITSMMVPDHSTIAEFRRRRERALGELFSAVLGLCREAWLVEVGVIAIDGTKIRDDQFLGCDSRDSSRC